MKIKIELDMCDAQLKPDDEYYEDKVRFEVYDYLTSLMDTDTLAYDIIHEF